MPIVELIDMFIEVLPPASTAGASELDPPAAAWMHANFTSKAPVKELGNAASYATRLRDYHGQDQVAAVVRKLLSKPATKSATITTLMPNDDTSYVPCVSLLDFKIRDGTMILTTTCRSLDIGKKALHNMVELAAIGEEVRAAVKVARLALHVHAISAHVYKRDINGLARDRS
ncbi:MAG: hypothetical protein GYA24_08260 [Candidatus Lokiarchaeota archaeon]|nr:hypothetical protein [Candidatus Lokiarchaeota archaeon]